MWLREYSPAKTRVLSLCQSGLEHAMVKCVDRIGFRCVTMLAAAAIVLSACTSTATNTSKGSSRTSESVSTLTTTNSSTSTTNSSATKGGAALLRETGVGNSTTRQFTVTMNLWTVSWSFDSCPSGGQGHFEVTVSAGKAAAASKFAPISAFDVSNAGTQRYAGSGTYSLVVLTSCAWSITVE